MANCKAHPLGCRCHALPTAARPPRIEEGVVIAVYVLAVLAAFAFTLWLTRLLDRDPSEDDQ